MYWTDLAFGIWAMLSRLELEYEGLNVGKNKFGLRIFFFWLGHELGPILKQGRRGPWGPAGAGLGPGKKPDTLNGSGPGHGSCPAGRVRATSLALRVGSGYGKTRPEPDSLPFLVEGKG